MLLMTNHHADRPLLWVGTSRDDLNLFPDEVKRVVGHALRAAQRGGKHADAKPLRGFGGAGVLEIVETFDGSAYRTVYTVRFSDAVYVLHAFEKKSAQGIATSKRDVALVHRRLLEARLDHAYRSGT
jgi:phage-related protein